MAFSTSWGRASGPVDLVDDHDGGQAQGHGLFQHEPGLGHGAFHGVDEQQHAVDHGEDALHLAAEVGVARGIQDVDLDAAIDHGQVLGHDGDAALPLQVERVHQALLDHLVVAEDVGLADHGVHQGGLAVVHVGDDGDIADIGADAAAAWARSRVLGGAFRLAGLACGAHQFLGRRRGLRLDV